MKILIIEDEPNLVSFLKKGLEEQRYQVVVAYDGMMGSKLALEQDFDLILLDIILPYVNGLEVCKEIRRYKKEVPILILTALGTVGDKVQGLENGADDYLTKPFHFDELLARIKALNRRKAHVMPGTKYIVADLVMDCFRRSVTRGGKEITLTSKEFTLLEVLMVNKDRVLSRSYIAESVWGISFDRGTNLIDVYINYLRAKIDKDFSKPLIQTVIGMGYVIKG